MASKLCLDGFCETMILDRHQSIQEMLSATSSLDFERVPAEFEPHYLGVDSKEKHALIDFEEATPEVGHWREICRHQCKSEAIGSTPRKPHETIMPFQFSKAQQE